MPAGAQLAEKEKLKIEVLKSNGWGIREIARKIKRSPTVVSNYIKLKSKYGLKGNRGRKKSISTLDRKKIIYLASQKKMNANQIKAELRLDQHKRTIQRVLSSCPHLIYKKYKKKPPLTQAHKKARLEFAETCIRNRVDFTKIVWSDEKKFNFDGPDGIHYYWHDLRFDSNYLSKRAAGGGSLKLWGAFVGNQLFELHFTDKINNSQAYTNMLEVCLLPFMDEDFTFMQDNASFHASNHSTEWLQNNNIKVLKWPANSPDLNPIENIWGILTRVVFANGKQYKGVQELTNAIKDAWDLISEETLINLNDSMYHRLISVIAEKGKNINY
jgi:transposase